MTDQERNTKLCEALGWTGIKETTILRGRIMRMGVWGYPPGDKTTLELLPNFFSPAAEGLWARHNAFMGLTDIQKVEFAGHLYERARHHHPDKDAAMLMATHTEFANSLYHTLCP